MRGRRESPFAGSTETRAALLRATARSVGRKLALYGGLQRSPCERGVTLLATSAALHARARAVARESELAVDDPRAGFADCQPWNATAVTRRWFRNGAVAAAAPRR